MLKTLSTASLALCACLPVWAGVVTLDFSSVTAGLSTNNFETQGFRVSPRCHFDPRSLASPVGGAVSTFLGADFGGCNGPNPPPPNPPDFNPNYLGDFLPAASKLLGYVDKPGAAFDFLYLDVESFETYEVASSKGGSLVVDRNQLPSGVHRVSFLGADWEGVTWITFNPGRGAGQPGGWMGNFTMRVADNALPEPTSLTLVFSGVALLAASARRKGA
jgi:hypothetical protein